MDTLRIGDADRESAVDLLGEHYALGRLTREEFDERSDAVWSARTRGDLATVFADLPVRTPGTGHSPPAGRARGRGPGRGRLLPLAPVVVALVALAVLLHVPFLLFLLVALLWFGPGRGACGPRRR